MRGRPKISFSWHWSHSLHIFNGTPLQDPTYPSNSLKAYMNIMNVYGCEASDPSDIGEFGAIDMSSVASQVAYACIYSHVASPFRPILRLKEHEHDNTVYIVVGDLSDGLLAESEATNIEMALQIPAGGHSGLFYIPKVPEMIACIALRALDVVTLGWFGLTQLRRSLQVTSFL